MKANVIRLTDDAAFFAAVALSAWCEDAERALSTASSQTVQYADNELRQTREYLERATAALLQIEGQLAARTAGVKAA